MTTQAKQPAVVNGFNATALGGLVEMLKAHPAGGRVTFLSDSRWKGGGRVSNSVRGYKIDGEMQHQNERAFTVVVDEPSEFGANDSASAPVEQLMYALGSCIAATTSAYAALRGIRLNRLEVKLEGEVDLHGMFGLDPGVRPGLGSIIVVTTIAGNADASTLSDIARQGYHHSVIRDSVANGVRMKPQVVAAS